MVAALAICILKDLNIVDEYENSLEPVKKRRGDDSVLGMVASLRCKQLIVFLSTAGLAGYLAFAIFCNSKETCNDITTYITIIPVCIMIPLYFSV